LELTLALSLLFSLSPCGFHPTSPRTPHLLVQIRLEMPLPKLSRNRQQTFVRREETHTNPRTSLRTAWSKSTIQAPMKVKGYQCPEISKTFPILLACTRESRATSPGNLSRRSKPLLMLAGTSQSLRRAHYQVLGLIRTSSNACFATVGIVKSNISVFLLDLLDVIAQVFSSSKTAIQQSSGDLNILTVFSGMLDMRRSGSRSSYPRVKRSCLAGTGGPQL
jgi:hypothetical protein